MERSETFMASDGVPLHYIASGAGAPVLLVHSFGFDAHLWVETGVVDALHRAGRSTIAIDCRGHGRSGKPAESSSYGPDRMAMDFSELLDHLAVDAVDLVSFSMGSFVALGLLQMDHRVRRAVLGGVGGAALMPELFDTAGLPASPSEGDAATLIAQLTPYLAQRVRDGRADARSLVAILRAGFIPSNKDFTAMTASVLFLAGDRDDDPRPLAATISGSDVQIVDTDHAGTMEHPDFVPAILRYLSD